MSEQSQNGRHPPNLAAQCADSLAELAAWCERRSQAKQFLDSQEQEWIRQVIRAAFDLQVKAVDAGLKLPEEKVSWLI